MARARWGYTGAGHCSTLQLREFLKQARSLRLPRPSARSALLSNAGRRATVGADRHHPCGPAARTDLPPELGAGRYFFLAWQGSAIPSSPVLALRYGHEASFWIEQTHGRRHPALWPGRGLQQSGRRPRSQCFAGRWRLSGIVTFAGPAAHAPKLSAEAVRDAITSTLVFIDCVASPLILPDGGVSVATLSRALPVAAPMVGSAGARFPQSLSLHHDRASMMKTSIPIRVPRKREPDCGERGYANGVRLWQAKGMRDRPRSPWTIAVLSVLTAAALAFQVWAAWQALRGLSW